VTVNARRLELMLRYLVLLTWATLKSKKRVAGSYEIL
jgi:hypothetical protein